MGRNIFLTINIWNNPFRSVAQKQYFKAAQHGSTMFLNLTTENCHWNLWMSWVRGKNHKSSRMEQVINFLPTCSQSSRTKYSTVDGSLTIKQHSTWALTSVPVQNYEELNLCQVDAKSKALINGCERELFRWYSYCLHTFCDLENSLHVKIQLCFLYCFRKC